MTTSSDKIIKTVMVRITHRRVVRARVSTAIHGTLVVLAVVAFVPALQSTMNIAASSGFFEYVSLAVSDGALISSYWKDFAFTLAESAPVVSSGIVLGIFLVFAYSSREVVSDLRRLRAQPAIQSA